MNIQNRLPPGGRFLLSKANRRPVPPQRKAFCVRLYGVYGSFSLLRGFYQERSAIPSPEGKARRLRRICVRLYGVYGNFSLLIGYLSTPVAFLFCHTEEEFGEACLFPSSVIRQKKKNWSLPVLITTTKSVPEETVILIKQRKTLWEYILCFKQQGLGARRLKPL